MSVPDALRYSASLSHDSEAVPACFHCGADCKPVLVEREGKDFCCEGCASVWSLLKDHEMNTYYDLNEHPGITAGKSTKRFDFLENAEVVQKLLDFAEGDTCKVHFRAPAIHCSSCIWLLERLPKLKNGILESRVNFPRKEISITFDRSKISLRQVVELVTAIGYEPNLQAEKEQQPKAVQRRLWLQLGIAGFCFGNIMLLSFPEYLGLDDPKFAAVFSYLNIGFSIPVVFYSARDYLRSAWKSLQHRGISMDVPISLGILVLFIRSVADILTHSGPGFLDSLAGLVFFLLLGKIFQDKTYNLLSFERDYRSYFPLTVTRIKEDSEEQAPLEDLNPGDRLLVRNGELIPADAVLVAGEGSIDYSFVTGESDLMPKNVGERLFAGGRQYGSSIEVLLDKRVDQSYLTRLWDNEVFKKKEKGRLTQIADRVSSIFTWTVLGIALAAGIFWWLWDSTQAVQVVTSVLIVACPCALALSTPFALGNALRILGRKGFFVKNTKVIESLAGADALVFDKTGTLTYAVKGSLNWQGKDLGPEDINALRTLFRQSSHPLSRRIFQNLEEGVLLDLEDFEEVEGKGLQARIAGRYWRAGSQKWLQPGAEASLEGKSRVYVFCEGEEWGFFDLGNHLREGAHEVVDNLREDYQLSMLTGDTERSRSQVLPVFKRDSELIFDQSPQDKLTFVKHLQEQGHHVVMIGDGLNDAGALQQSDAGIAVADDAASFTPASDAILFAGSFADLPKFFRFSRAAVQVIRASFGLSLLYNVIGLSFAVSGLLSPLVAAILMPLSSISVIAFTTLGTSFQARRFKVWQSPQNEPYT